ncbi:MAG: tetratricopeptide repeat protein [Bacteroidales bacterium]|nr:tetratricopeptide repeat protein [Bacteroidales bacterium]
MAKEIKNENQQAVAEAVSKTDLFFNENKKAIIICAAVAVLVFVGLFLFQKFVYIPQRAEALEQLYPAETVFMMDKDYELALNGNDDIMGFAAVIDQYGKKAGAAVYLYAGICELQLGDFESAISYLKKYNGKDNILAARAQACIGDAYVGLDQNEKALGFFLKAAKTSDNVFSADYLLKAGVVYEQLGKDDKALECYKQIKDQYPMARVDAEKYIARIEAKKANN